MNKNSAFFRVLIVSMLSLPFLQACQDDEELFVDKKSEVPSVGNRMELTLDSVFLYAKEIYLWNDALPEYGTFNPRKYTQYSEELQNLSKEVFDISQFKINPATGNPYEFVSHSAPYAKYSYVIESDEEGSGNQSAKSALPADETYFDFGFALAAKSASDIRFRNVFPNSPASIAGLKRGDRLLKMNGVTVKAGSQSDVDYINNSMEKGSIALSVEKVNGSVVEINLNQATYPVNPVMKSTVLDRGSKKVGYLVYDSFTRMSNSQSELDAAFNKFASAGVTDLVVDLRYNGGGYVRTAEHLINLIAPSSLNGSVMYSELYNEQMRSGKAEILKNQLLLDENGEPQKYQGRNATYFDLDYTEEGNTFKFNKAGALENIENVCFIVGEGTASASELVINALKPYLNVTIIGEQTYGKPVGFFGIYIDEYKVYFPNFKTINSQGEGEYFDGLSPDIKAYDDPTRDFGDPEEESLATALSYIENGELRPNFRMSKNRAAERISSQSEAIKIGEDRTFKGMIEDRVQLP